MKLSILTATYNRGYLLGNLYKSIVDNLYNKLDVEWIIMDDGSTDNTKEIVEKFKNAEHLEIRYFKQENQGKMQAINNLIKYVTGELVMDCDSDDYFVKNAFKQIYDKKDILLKDNNLYGLIFLKNESHNKLSGNRFDNENNVTTMFDMYFKDGILGEKIIVFKTDIRKKYNHELVDGEKFITEARMYHKMDDNYGVKCFNIVIVEGKYLESGYTSNINQTFIKYPNGYFCYFREILEKDMKKAKLNKRLYAVKHYILFSYIAKKRIILKDINSLINRVLIVMLYIPGIYKSKKFVKEICHGKY